GAFCSRCVLRLAGVYQINQFTDSATFSITSWPSGILISNFLPIQFMNKKFRFRTNNRREAKLCYMGHAVMENRNGLAVDGTVTQASGTAERRASEAMLKKKAKRSRSEERRVGKECKSRRTLHH